jgi:hypothetical protein
MQIKFKEQFMRVFKRFRGLGALALVALTTVTLAGCGAEEKQEAAPVVRPVKTLIVGGFAGGEVTYPGTVQAAQRMELSFRVDGPLIELPIKEGQQVTTRSPSTRPKPSLPRPRPISSAIRRFTSATPCRWRIWSCGNPSVTWRRRSWTTPS